MPGKKRICQVWTDSVFKVQEDGERKSMLLRIHNASDGRCPIPNSLYCKDSREKMRRLDKAEPAQR